MAGFYIISLTLSLTLLSIVNSEKTELATEVCKNTTDFDFCRSAIYSDPHAPTADRFMLINIVNKKASTNASNTRDYIADNIKSGQRETESLKKCLGDYNKAIDKLFEMFTDFESDNYYGLDVMCVDVEQSVLNCKKVLQGNSIIWTRNENMLKLANVCYVTAKLFN